MHIWDFMKGQRASHKKILWIMCIKDITSGYQKYDRSAVETDSNAFLP